MRCFKPGDRVRLREDYFQYARCIDNYVDVLIVSTDIDYEGNYKVYRNRNAFGGYLPALKKVFDFASPIWLYQKGNENV